MSGFDAFSYYFSHRARLREKERELTTDDVAVEVDWKPPSPTCEWRPHKNCPLVHLSLSLSLSEPPPGSHDYTKPTLCSAFPNSPDIKN